MNFIKILVSIIIGSTLIILIYAASQPTSTVTLLFAGDTMLGRTVDQYLATLAPAMRNVYPWGNVLPLFHTTDLNIINLETTLTTSTDKTPKVFNFKAHPDLVLVLKAARIDIVNLANNHILDFGIKGLQETISVLDAAGIKHVGAGNNEDKARAPVILVKKGIRIGILGYTDNEPTWQAGPHQPGTNYVRVENISQVKKDVENVRANVDVLIVTIHWGPNMRSVPSKEFQDFAHAIIDAGVDIIHGHSAHVIQGVEWYKDKLIMYDTGDLVDDYRVDPELRNDLSFLFLVTVNKQGLQKLKLLPTAINHMQLNRARGMDAISIMNRMKLLSAQLGTEQLEFIS